MQRLETDRKEGGITPKMQALFSFMHLCSICRSMKTYLDQLNEQAAPTGVKLLEFFKLAGIPTSTYYRAINGKDMRWATAMKVEDAITSYSLHRAEASYE